MSERNSHVSSTSGSPLRGTGRFEDTKYRAVKVVLVYKMVQAVKAQSLSKAIMAKRMKACRSQPDRPLDPERENVMLHTMERAVAALGMRLKIELCRI